MSMYSKLAKNSIVFAIGNLGSKIILFLLVPIYTYTLTVSEYGQVDILTSTINLLLPIITLSIFDSVLRFTLDKNYNPSSVLTNSFIIIILGFLILILFIPLFQLIHTFNKYLAFFFLILLSQAVNTTFSQFVRAVNHVNIFALSGIVNAIMVLLSNLVFLIWLDMGIEGYLISIFLGNIISILFLMFMSKIYKYIDIKEISPKLTKELLIFCLPLIPNALMWWIMNTSNRYFITFFIGMGATGLFAVATKFPSLLNILNTIFFQAWQMSAIEEAESKNKKGFYNNVYKYYSFILIVTTSLLLVFIKHITKILVAPEFYDSWKYIPLLLLSIVFSSLSSFLGTNYIAAKDTRGVFKSSMLGGIINLVLNLILIPFIGTYGAAVSVLISYFIIWIYRLRDTRSFVEITIDTKKFSLAFVLLFCQIGVLYLDNRFEIVIELVIFMLILFIYKRNVKMIISNLKKLGNRLIGER
ncbi:lipopolysaccharide biosynthesis protein [Niallia sp. 01092]|uniref:lipopolysaccharide biosynthesis protein n=1 Tax=Niallia sp. 01092 TaxID=3457759 RepID=UPI003FD69D03